MSWEIIDYLDVDNLCISARGFADFAREQGDDYIDHSAEEGSAWASCAVGQYFTSLCGRVLQYPESDAFCTRLFSEVGEFIYTELGESNIATYAELAQLIQRHEEIS